MILEMQWRADENRNNVEEGSQGGYSEELEQAMDLLAELEQ